MKTISVFLGRVAMMKPLHEFAPLGGVYLPRVFDAIKAKYLFATTPSAAQAEGYKFSIGRIMKGGRECPIQELAIFTDGVVCSADDTDTAELFLGDLLWYLREQFGFREIHDGVRKLFNSQVWVQFDKSLDGLLSKVESIADAIGKAEASLYGIKGESVHLHSVVFDYDRTKISPMLENIAPFRIERKIKAPFSENVLYSVAPLRTKTHLEVLEQIERIAGS
ncbi:MAG: hypothetical protein HY644_03255 [Acidobacteria bacterium]|nr:hypothetical protein [Acidobacteriota bacterium]